MNDVAFNISHKSLLEGASAPSKVKQNIQIEVDTPSGKRRFEAIFQEVEAIKRAKVEKV